MELIFVDVMAWVFVLYCLFYGRKVKNILPSGSNVIALVTFIILGALVVFKSYTVLGIRSLVHGGVISLAGIVYSIIPTGYDDEAIYLSGRKYMYKNMKTLEIIEEKKKYRLTFIYKGRAHFVAVDKEERYLLEDIEMRYKKARILK